MQGSWYTISMNVKENVQLSPFTTFHVGGSARYFVEVKSVDDLIVVTHEAGKKQRNMFILGGGSNILISDEGFDGYVIQMNIGGVDVNKLDDGNYEVIVGAGENWDALVEFCVSKGLWGLENLSYIPGSVGGAVVGNIGAYGAEMADAAHWVEVFDRRNGVTRKLMKNECGFGYRESIFKSEEGEDLVVTRVCMLLSEKGKPNTTYKEIETIFKKAHIEKPTLDQMRKLIGALRKKKLPDWKRFGSAGSFFTNPIVSRFKFIFLKWKYPGLQGNKVEGGIKISAAWLIDHVCDLKGLKINNVSLYTHQPLIIVTENEARAKDVMRLSQLVIREVCDKTKIKLEPEVIFVGF